MSPNHETIEGFSVLTDVRLESWSVASCNLETQVDTGPETLFKLLADPSQHSVLFDSIKKVESELLEDDGQGGRQWKVDYHAGWQFWKLGGILKIALIMDTNATEHSISFKLREPGFLTTFEGGWSLKAVPCATSSTSGPQRDSNTPLDKELDGSGVVGVGSSAPSFSADHTPADVSSDNNSGGGEGNSFGCRGGAIPPADDIHAPPGVESGDVSDWGVSAISMVAKVPLSTSRSQHCANNVQRLDTTCAAGSAASATSGLPDDSAIAASAGGAGSCGGTAVRFQQRMGPRVAPPFPLNQMLKGQLMGQARQMLGSLLVNTRPNDAT